MNKIIIFFIFFILIINSSSASFTQEGYNIQHTSIVDRSITDNISVSNTYNTGITYNEWGMPIVDSNNNIFFGDADYYLYSLYPNFSLRWKQNNYADVQSTYILDKNEDIIIPNENYGIIIYYNENGTIKLQGNVSSYGTFTYPDITGIYNPLLDRYYGIYYSVTPLPRYNTLLSINTLTGNLDCSYNISTSGIDYVTFHTPVIDNDNNVIFISGNGTIYSLNGTDCTENWINSNYKFPDYNDVLYNDISIDSNNNIYTLYSGFYGSSALNNTYFLVLYPNGTEKSIFSPYPTYNDFYTHPLNNPVIDEANNLYYFTFDNYAHSIYKLYALYINNNTEKWNITTQWESYVISDNNNKLVVLSNYNQYPLFIYNSNDGSLYNNLTIPDSDGSFYGQATIDNDGRILWMDNNGYVYAVGDLSYDVSGNIKYKDIDDSLNNLENAEVYINLTCTTLTDSDGNFILPCASLGDTIYVTANDTVLNAFSTNSSIISSYTNNNMIIEFSKPNLDNFNIVGNYLQITYSHNFKNTNIWENPNFVWGNYTYRNTTTSYIKACNYLGNNIFACEVIPDKNYDINFIYSDIYNYNLDVFHPSLSGQRTFTTNTYSITNNAYINETDEIIKEVKPISKTDFKDREIAMRNYFWDFLFIMVCIFVYAYLKTFEKNKRK